MKLLLDKFFGNFFDIKISNLLLNSFQIPRYIITIHELLAHTPHDHVERKSLEFAQSKLEELSQVCNIFSQGLDIRVCQLNKIWNPLLVCAVFIEPLQMVQMFLDPTRYQQ